MTSGHGCIIIYGGMEKKALVVEYEPRYVQRLTSALHEHGYEVMVAMDGEEALKKAREMRPDLVFLSAVIPKLRSSEVVHGLRSIPELARTRIILLATGIREEAIEDEKRKKGVDSILSKPFSETRIIELIDSLAAEPPRAAAPPLSPSTDIPSHAVSPGVKKLTSEDLFGEFLEGGSRPTPSGAVPVVKPVAPKAETKNSGVDDLLQKALSDLSPIRPKKADAGVKPPDPAAKLGGGLDRRLSDTLSGLDITIKSRRTNATPSPAVAKTEPPRSVAQAPAVESPAPAAPPTSALTQPWDIVTPASVKDLPLDVPAPPAKAEPVPMPAPKEEGQQFGNYLLVEKLATGGMAEIYKAKMSGVEGFQKTVAIKRILPQYSNNQEFTTMFIDEAKLAAQLSHRNIVHIYDLGKLEDSYFIAMENVEGIDLRQVNIRMRERGQRMPAAVALYICGQIASALDYAHKKQDAEGRPLNIVHRDVSPQNILLGFDGQIKICDFGIAKAASKASHTRAGSLKGKLQYMSPEQAWGRQVDYRSDLFSLAVVLFELLSGRGLFEGESELSILEKVRHPRVEPLSAIVPGMPAEIDRVVQKALQEKPEQRYPEAALFARDLEEILSHYAPRVTEKSVAQCLAFLNGQGTLPVFSYVRPAEPAPLPAETAAPRVESRPEEASDPAEAVMDAKEWSHERGKKAKPWAEKPVEPPAPVKPPPLPPVPPAGKMEDKEAAAAIEKKKPPMAWIAAGAVVVLLILVGVYFAGGRKTALQEVAPVQPPAKEAPAQAQLPSPVPAAAEQTKPTPAATPAGPMQTPAKAVEQPKPVAPAAAVPPKRVPPAETAKPAPAPPLEETKPAPAVETSNPAPETPLEQPKPAPAAAPPAAQFKTGDMVTTDTPGLAPPRVLKKAVPAYPPMARMQKVQGDVSVQVLVDENGRVADARVLSGPTLLHSTARDAAKACEFQPAQISGVKVKCAYTLVFTFRL